MRQRLIKWLQIQIKASKNQLFRMFLMGAQGRLRIYYDRPYNYYMFILRMVGTLVFARWLIDFHKLQMDTYGYNWLVPAYVYRVRQQSHIYWQLARVAQGLPTTFTYYKWDNTIMFEINRKGQQNPVQSHTGIESIDTFSSPFLEYNFPASPQRHAQIIQYQKNIHNPYDLYNHLRFKSINIGDFIRAAYYAIYRELGLTNRWRYDEFVSKPDIYYRWQKLKLALRISRDRKSAYQILDTYQFNINDVMRFMFWFS